MVAVRPCRLAWTPSSNGRPDARAWCGSMAGVARATCVKHFRITASTARTARSSGLRVASADVRARLFSLRSRHRSTLRRGSPLLRRWKGAWVGEIDRLAFCVLPALQLARGIEHGIGDGADMRVNSAQVA